MEVSSWGLVKGATPLKELIEMTCELITSNAHTKLTYRHCYLINANLQRAYNQAQFIRHDITRNVVLNDIRNAINRFLRAGRIDKLNVTPELERLKAQISVDISHKKTTQPIIQS